jgi:radical SAM protein with 4Fe4S-binding SPASM domain
VTNEREIRSTKKLFGIPDSSNWPDSEAFIGTLNGINPEVVVQQIKGLYSNFAALVYQSPEMSEEKIRSYYSNIPFQLRKQCFAPWFKVHIRSNGDVTPCADFIIGNIYQERFIDIWNGEKMQDFRSKLRQFGKFPFCDRKCCDNHFKKAVGVYRDTR